ncbi:hypothetical protein G6F68_021035 [Rhizopus microsporus]|nr:hypothetical protein G6F68_021035 [Rhizopus microsporus]
MGLMPAGGYDNGELPGFLAYFLPRNQADYQRYLGNLGLYPATAWAGVNTGPLWDRTGRKRPPVWRSCPWSTGRPWKQTISRPGTGSIAWP